MGAPTRRITGRRTVAARPPRGARAAPWTLGLCAAVLVLAPGCAARRPPLLAVIAADAQPLSLDVRGTVLPVRARPGLRVELDALRGARIAARVASVGAAVRVAGYELLEGPDGLPAYVGVLVVDQGGVRLDLQDGSALLLRAADLDALRAAHGARVWVTGTVVGPQTLLVAHWGTLTRP